MRAGDEILYKQQRHTLSGVQSPFLYTQSGLRLLVGDCDLVRACGDGEHLTALLEASNSDTSSSASLLARAKLGLNVVPPEVLYTLRRIGYEPVCEDDDILLHNPHTDGRCTIMEAVKLELWKAEACRCQH